MAAPIDKNQELLNLADLPLAQLEQVKAQLQEEIGHFSNSFTKLKQAQATFKDCQTNLNSISKSTTDTPVLVPLTSSHLYVPGTLSNVTNVMVDVGTGYYIEKPISEATKFYQTKVTEIQKSLDQIQDTLTKKQNNFNVLIDILKFKAAKAQSPAKSVPSRA